MPRLELFWDVGSPYTYLATTQLEGLRRRTGAEVVLRPFLLGGVFKATGNSAPTSVAAKSKYLSDDLRRWRDHYQVRMKIPPDEVLFPINSVLPMRAAIAAEIMGAGEKFAMALLDAYWVHARDVSLPEEVAKVAVGIGLDDLRVLEGAGRSEVKDTLRANTEEAIKRGAFGAPAMFIGDDLYWGNDRLAFVEQHLKR
jgi:2-hydroxychromene-2-carboxylate isomerase